MTKPTQTKKVTKTTKAAKPSVAVQAQTTSRLMMDLADTTWRVVVPVVVLAVPGLIIDRNNGDKPVFTLIGAAIGIIFAALLIMQQLKRTAPKVTHD